MNDVTVASVDVERSMTAAGARSLQSTIRVLALPLLLLLAWEAGYQTHRLPSYLVGPSAIAATAYQMAADGELWKHAGISLLRSYAGFVLGAAAGIAVGLPVALSGVLRGFCDPLVSLTYPVPKVAILPILMVWLGTGDASKIAIIALSVFYPVYISAYQGALSVNPLLISAARTFGAGAFRIFLQVMIPASLPAIFVGLRVGLGLSFILLFASELVSANRGLGYLIVQAQMFQRFDIMFVAVATIGACGFVSDRLLLAIRRTYFSHHVASPSP
jgi:ABC-type nitrate/sulfonate/bicarbonate transport system permease component